MVSVITTFCRIQEKDEIVIIQLYTQCCKEKLIFKKISINEYFSFATQENCPEGWNNQIRTALENFYDCR